MPHHWNRFPSSPVGESCVAMLNKLWASGLGETEGVLSAVKSYPQRPQRGLQSVY